MVVERPDRRDEPAVGRVLGDGVGEALGGAQVRAIEHQQRRLVLVAAERWRGDGGGGLWTRRPVTCARLPAGRKSIFILLLVAN